MSASKPSENDARKKISQLHEALGTLAPEAKCVLNMSREHDWWEWLKWRAQEPFTEQDLLVVVRYRRGLISKGSQFAACLKFSHLIGRPDFFEEDLAMARAQPPKQTDRDRVLKLTCRTSAVELQQEKREKLAGSLAQAALERLREAAR